MVGLRITVLSLLFVLCLVVPSWSYNNETKVNDIDQTNISDNNDDKITNKQRNAGENIGRTRLENKGQKYKNRNKKEKKLEKKYKKKNKNGSKKNEKGSTRMACNTGMRNGTRVVRNDLDWSWGDQDGGAGSKGTVTSLIGTGSHRDGWIRVKWENGNENDYRWGRFGKADIKVYCQDSCDTALKVGARVVRDEGFWSYGDQDGGPGSIGTITGLDNNVLFVHWERVDHRNNYKWSQNGETDVKVYCQGSCTGTTSDWSCCSSSSPCQENEGDCDNNSECAGALVCGKDNCQKINPLAHRLADCCVRSCAGGSSDWSCCSSTSPCQAAQGDCDYDSDCAGSLVCGYNNCQKFNPFAHTAADCCINPNTEDSSIEKIVTACEWENPPNGGQANLNCQYYGTGKIKITHVLYGRQDHSTCIPSWVDTKPFSFSCSADGAYTKVKQLCEGRERCSVAASNGYFGDPCYGTWKYLTITYSCQGQAMPLPIG